MFRCEKCKRLFDDDEVDTVVLTDYYPYGNGSSPWQHYEDRCPFCGCEDMEKVYVCEKCGKVVDYLEDGECEDCFYKEMYSEDNDD